MRQMLANVRAGKERRQDLPDRRAPAYASVEGCAIRIVHAILCGECYEGDFDHVS